jgi:uncharacterized protein
MGHGDWKQLIAGVQSNDVKKVKFYISEKIDLDFQHPEFMSSALIESIRLGHYEIAKLLLENGASATLKEAYSNLSPLSVAKSTKSKAMITLIQSYCKPQERHSLGRIIFRLLSYRFQKT